MTKITKINYDELRDCLLFSLKKDKDVVQGSAVAGNAVLDFTKKGKLVGIEIEEVTEK